MSEHETKSDGDDLADRLKLLIEGVKKIEDGEIPLTLSDVLKEGRRIWGEERLDLPGVIVRLGVNTGKLCRAARNATKDYHGADQDEALGRDIRRAMGHTIVSMIRWADDLGINVSRAVIDALLEQAEFAKKNERR